MSSSPTAFRASLASPRSFRRSVRTSVCVVVSLISMLIASAPGPQRDRTFTLTASPGHLPLAGV